MKLMKSQKVQSNGIELFLPIKKGYKKMLSNKIYLTLLLSVVLFSSCSKSEEEQVREEIAKEITDEMVARKIEQKKKNEEKKRKAKISKLRNFDYYQQMIVIEDLKNKGTLTGKAWWVAYNDITNWSNGNHNNKPNYGDFSKIDLSQYESNKKIKSLIKSLNHIEAEGQ